MATNTPEYRERIGNVSAALFRIHKIIMENEMEALEAAEKKTMPPAERLNALLNHPNLAWLRDMSRLMSFVDEVYFQKEAISERQMQEIEDRVHTLFSLENETEFTYRYRKSLGTVPDLMYEHGLLKIALKKADSKS